MFSLATPVTQLFAISTSNATEKNLNKRQKQEIYKIENCECALIHSIEKAIFICYYCECLSGNKKHKVDLFTLSCIVIID